MFRHPIRSKKAATFGARLARGVKAGVRALSKHILCQIVTNAGKSEPRARVRPRQRGGLRLQRG